MRNLSARRLLVLLGAAVVAAVLVQAGSASAPSSGNKLFDACLSYQGAPDCSSVPTTKTGDATQLPGGSKPILTFKLWNDLGSGSSLTIGSMQLQAPSGFTIDTSNLVPPSGANLGPTTSSSFELVNLNLSNGQFVTVSFTTSTPIPCSGGGTWKVIAKQSNNFSGPPGNDFAQNFTTGLTSTIDPGCSLAWVNQPADALQTTKAQAFPITSSPYDTTGPSVQVEALGADGSRITSATGTVTLAPDAGILWPSSGNIANAFTGTTAQLNGGIATFTGFEGTQTGTGFTVSASDLADGYSSTPDSNPFNISAGETCPGGNCQSFTSQLDGDTQVTSSASGGVFKFLAIDSGTPLSAGDLPSGCENLKPLGGAVVNETDGRTADQTGTLTFVYAIGKKLVQATSNNGNPFIPICAGAQMVGSDGTPVACDPNTSPLDSGWVDETLNPDGTFSGATGHAVCNSDGFWWGILGTQQDSIPAGNPQETSWQGGSQYRYFTITVPWPWDMQWGG